MPVRSADKLKAARWESLVKSGRAALRDGRLDEAARYYIAAAKLPLYRAAALAQLAAVQARQGRLALAEKTNGAVLKLAPGNLEARLLKAELLYAKGERRAAARLARELLAGNPGLEAARALLTRALVTGRAGLSEEDLRYLLPRGAGGPGSRSENEEKFILYLCAGRFGRAFELGEELLDSPGRVMGAMEFTEPWAYLPGLDRGLPARLLARLAREKLTGRPGLWREYYLAMLAAAAGARGTAGPALAGLRAAPAPRYGWMRLMRGLYFSGESLHASAIREFGLVLRAMPDDWAALCLTGEALIAGGKTAEGFRKIDRACRTARNDKQLSAAEAWRGEMLLFLGQYEKAVAYLDRALAHGAGPSALGWKGAACVKLGKYNEALELLDEAVRASYTDDMESRLWRAEARRLRGDRDLALADLEHVLKKGPDFWAYCNRALISHAAGNFAAARKDLCRLDPELLKRAAARLGTGTRPRDPAQIKSMLELFVESARGNRRSDPSQLRFWGRLFLGR